MIPSYHRTGLEYRVICVTLFLFLEEVATVVDDEDPVVDPDHMGLDVDVVLHVDREANREVRVVPLEGLDELGDGEGVVHFILLDHIQILTDIPTKVQGFVCNFVSF